MDPKRSTYSQDPSLQARLVRLENNEPINPKYSLDNGLLRNKNCVVLSSKSPSCKQLMYELNNASSAGHSGFRKTYKQIHHTFYCPGVKGDIWKYVANCEVCQRNKIETLWSLGLLQPLEIPNWVWVDLSMDFINRLPPPKGKSVIFFVVDRLSKYAHFITRSHPYKALKVAQAFFF